MDEVPVLPPKRTRTSLGRIAIGVLVAIALVPIGFVLHFVESRLAIEHWESVGGGIDSAETQLSFSPSLRNDASVDEIVSALRRMRRVPGCIGLTIDRDDFAPDEIDRMILAFRPVDFGAVGTRLNDDCLETLATVSGLRSVTIQRESDATLDGVRDLLSARPDLKVYVERSSYEAAGLRELERAFPDRLVVWNR